MAFDVNYAPVIVSAIIFMIVGTLWYGPFFGKRWLKLIGQAPHVTSAESKNQKSMSMSASMFGVFIAALVMSFVIAVVIKSLLITTVSAALVAGFMLWLGFVATTMSYRIFFERSSTKLFLINASQSLVAMLLGSLIIVLWPW